MLALLVVATAGYMLVDGARALVVGEYFTIEGELGPWAAIADAIGIGARSFAMKALFVAWGAAWLVALAAYLMGRAGWRLMLVAAVASLWYLVVGTLFALAQIALLLLVVARREA